MCNNKKKYRKAESLKFHARIFSNLISGRLQCAFQCIQVGKKDTGIVGAPVRRITYVTAFNPSAFKVHATDMRKGYRGIFIRLLEIYKCVRTEKYIIRKKF